MNKKIPSIPAIGIIALTALLVGTVVVLINLQINKKISFYSFEPSEPQDETAGWQTYRNEEYGYEIKYPKDWRIAGPIMKWHEKDADSYCSYRNNSENWVMITNLSVAEEKDYLQALEDYDGLGSAYSHIENADGRSIDIFPSNISTEELKNLKPEVGWEPSNFREEETKLGLKIVRWRERITWEMNRDFENAYIFYSGGKILCGKKITYIVLKIERNNGNYEADIFNKILSTFKFID